MAIEPFVIELFLSSFVFRPKCSIFNLSTAGVVAVVEVTFNDSLSSMEFVLATEIGAASFFPLFISSICLVADAPVVGRGPVMGARPDGVSASTVK